MACQEFRSKAILFRHMEFFEKYIRMYDNTCFQKQANMFRKILWQIKSDRVLTSIEINAIDELCIKLKKLVEENVRRESPPNSLIENENTNIVNLPSAVTPATSNNNNDSGDELLEEIIEKKPSLNPQVDLREASVGCISSSEDEQVPPRKKKPKKLKSSSSESENDEIPKVTHSLKRRRILEISTSSDENEETINRSRESRSSRRKSVKKSPSKEKPNLTTEDIFKMKSGITKSSEMPRELKLLCHDIDRGYDKEGVIAASGTRNRNRKKVNYKESELTMLEESESAVNTPTTSDESEEESTNDSDKESTTSRSTAEESNKVSEESESFSGDDSSQNSPPRVYKLEDFNSKLFVEKLDKNIPKECTIKDGKITPRINPPQNVDTVTTTKNPANENLISTPTSKGFVLSSPCRSSILLKCEQRVSNMSFVKCSGGHKYKCDLCDIYCLYQFAFKEHLKLPKHNDTKWDGSCQICKSSPSQSQSIFDEYEHMELHIKGISPNSQTARKRSQKKLTFKENTAKPPMVVINSIESAAKTVTKNNEQPPMVVINSTEIAAKTVTKNNEQPPMVVINSTEIAAKTITKNNEQPPMVVINSTEIAAKTITKNNEQPPMVVINSTEIPEKTDTKNNEQPPMVVINSTEIPAKTVTLERSSSNEIQNEIPEPEVKSDPSTENSEVTQENIIEKTNIPINSEVEIKNEEILKGISNEGIPENVDPENQSSNISEIITTDTTIEKEISSPQKPIETEALPTLVLINEKEKEKETNTQISPAKPIFLSLRRLSGDKLSTIPENAEIANNQPQKVISNVIITPQPVTQISRGANPTNVSPSVITSNLVLPTLTQLPSLVQYQPKTVLSVIPASSTTLLPNTKTILKPVANVQPSKNNYSRILPRNERNLSMCNDLQPKAITSVVPTRHSFDSVPPQATIENPVKVMAILLHKNTVLRPWLQAEDFKTKNCSTRMLKTNCLRSFYKCMAADCDFFTDDGAEYSKHISEEIGIKKCCYCSFKSDDHVMVYAHLKNIHGSSEFACNLCFYRGVSRFFINAHIQKYHKDNKDAAILNVTPLKKSSLEHDVENAKANKSIFVKPAICAACSAKFYNIQAFEQHRQRSHANATNLSRCNTCKKNIKMDQIHLHLNSCHNIKKFHCVKCTYGSNLIDEIKDHLTDNHPDVSPLYCDRSGSLGNNNSHSSIDSTDIFILYFMMKFNKMELLHRVV